MDLIQGGAAKCPSNHCISICETSTALKAPKTFQRKIFILGLPRIYRSPMESLPITSSRSGGIGRRAGFKIRFPQGSVGSTPTFGTSSLGQMKLGGHPGSESPTFGGGVAKRSNASDCKSDDFGLRRFESFPRHHLFLLLLLLLLVIIIKYVMFTTKVAKHAKIFLLVPTCSHLNLPRVLRFLGLRKWKDGFLPSDFRAVCLKPTERIRRSITPSS